MEKAVATTGANPRAPGPRAPGRNRDTLMVLGMHLQLVSVTLSVSRRCQWYALDVQFNLWEGFIAMDEPLVQGEYSDYAMML